MTNNKDKKVLNVPNLRFPEFTGEWKKERLDEIAELSKGIGISKEQLSSNGNPCILYGELYTKYKSEIISEVISKTNIEKNKLKHSKQNDVIIPCSGETAVDIAVARCVPFDNVLLGGDLNIIRLHKYDGAFMAYQLNSKRKIEIAKLAQGVSVVHLYGENLKSINTFNPSLQEQQKIVRLLSLLDERIKVQNKIIEDLKKLKSAIYQELFSNLQGEEKSLSELAEITKGQQVNGNQLNENGKYYVMNGGIMPSGYYDDYNTEAGTISISEGGNSCGYVQYNKSKFWSGGHCYTLHIKPTARISTLFLFHFLKWKEEDIMALRIGSGLPNIQKKDLSKVRIIVPTFDKQQRLIALLSTLQMKIEYEEMYTINLDKQKLHLLSQMFI
ncbi:restriction endonuclease subunit S [Phocaeicola vulgatus]|nr:restriction endonuclease subunit S [Phocaeicola vulgatus]